MHSTELREEWLPLAKSWVMLYLILKLKNFEHAGKTLGEVWSKMVTNGYPVIAKYIGNKASGIANNVSEKWRLSHVRSFQYLL